MVWCIKAYSSSCPWLFEGSPSTKHQYNSYPAATWLVLSHSAYTFVPHMYKPISVSCTSSTFHSYCSRLCSALQRRELRNTGGQYLPKYSVRILRESLAIIFRHITLCAAWDPGTSSSCNSALAVNQISIVAALWLRVNDDKWGSKWS